MRPLRINSTSSRIRRSGSTPTPSRSLCTTFSPKTEPSRRTPTFHSSRRLARHAETNGTNTSDSNRIGLTIGLDLGYLRQEENAYLTYPTEVVKTFDEDIQQLLGWSVCPPGTGC